MKPHFRFLFLLFFAFFSTVYAAKAHPYYVSIAEVKYNTKSQSLEIALKLFTDDLEKTLSETAGKPVVITSDAAVVKMLEAYFQKHFQVELPQNQVVLPRSFGYQKEDDAHWFFLAIPLKAEQLEDAKLRNQVLMETFTNQINLTHLEINGKKRTLIFKEGDVLKALL